MTSQRVLLADATSKTIAFRGLSVQAVQRGDLWLAVHAQAASDVSFTRSFCLQNSVPTGYTDEAIELLQTADAPVDLTEADGSTEGFPVYGDTPGIETDVTCREAIKVFRGAIAATLPDWDLDRWASSLPAITHLPARDMPQARTFRDDVMDRFAGDDPESYLHRRDQDRLAAIEDYEEAIATGQTWNAVAAIYAADTAAFDMWLLQRSLLLGDPQLTQYEMLWRLASHTIDQLSNLPEDPREAMFLLRVRLIWVVGPREAENLRAAFYDPS